METKGRQVEISVIVPKILGKEPRNLGTDTSGSNHTKSLKSTTAMEAAQIVKSRDECSELEWILKLSRFMQAFNWSQLIQVEVISVL